MDIDNTKTEIGDKNKVFFEVRIVRSETLVKEIRRVSSIMQFLGEAGGIYSSIFIIGKFLSFLFSGKDSTL